MVSVEYLRYLLYIEQINWPWLPLPPHAPPQRDFKVRKVQESVDIHQLQGVNVNVEEEVEYTPLRPAVIPSNLSFSSGGFPRSESQDSADRFLPNLLSPAVMAHGDSSSSNNSFSNHLSLHPGGNNDLRHSVSSGDIQTSHHSDFNMGNSAINSPHHHASINNNKLHHNPVQMCLSAPNNPSAARNIRNQQVNSYPPTSRPPLSRADEIQSSMMSTGLSTDSGIVVPGQQNAAKPPMTLLEQSGHVGSVEEEELSRMKLNTRRQSRTEKRYHTADSIQEMKNQDNKDSSIHKRLSWRTDVNVDNRSLSSKVLSSDSVRSAPSSSGVSSTGSLHLNPESDISEEVEGSRLQGGVSTFKSGHKNMFSFGDPNDDPNRDDYDPGYLEIENSFDKNKSRSTSDLIEVFNKQVHISDMEDGIASVEVNADGGIRKYTHADIIKMKKLKHQILFDNEIESS